MSVSFRPQQAKKTWGALSESFIRMFCGRMMHQSHKGPNMPSVFQAVRSERNYDYLVVVVRSGLSTVKSVS